MAKNCINPQCEKEIPSSAIFCSFCGTQQINDGELSEKEKLRKELTEAEETIKILKKALADAHEKIDKGTDDETIQSLNEELEDARDNQENLRNQISAKNKEIEQLKNTIKKTKNNGGLIFFFVLVSVALGITAAYFYNENESWKSNYYSESSNNSDNQNKIQNLRNEVDNLQRQNSNLQSENSNLKTKMPMTYKINFDANYYYKYRCTDLTHTNCYVPSGRYETIYVIENGWGLTKSGWLNMSYLEKQ